MMAGLLILILASDVFVGRFVGPASFAMQGVDAMRNEHVAKTPLPPRSEVLRRVASLDANGFALHLCLYLLMRFFLGGVRLSHF